MNKQVSPALIAAMVAVVVIALGAIYYRQFVYTAPTPHPNRGVNTGGKSAPGLATPGH